MLAGRSLPTWVRCLWKSVLLFLLQWVTQYVWLIDCSGIWYRYSMITEITLLDNTHNVATSHAAAISVALLVFLSGRFYRSLVWRQMCHQFSFRGSHGARGLFLCIFRQVNLEIRYLFDEIFVDFFFFPPSVALASFMSHIVALEDDSVYFSFHLGARFAHHPRFLTFRSWIVYIPSGPGHFLGE